MNELWIIVQEGSSVALESSESMVVDEAGGRVQFKPLHKDNEARYRCRATNDVGHATASGQLTVLGQSIIHSYTHHRKIPRFFRENRFFESF